MIDEISGDLSDTSHESNAIVSIVGLRRKAVDSGLCDALMDL